MLGRNANPYELWKKRGERHAQKHDKKRLMNALQMIQDKKGKNDWIEKGLRTIGTGVGAYFGGSVGAGIGNLLGGGIADIADDNDEALYEDMDFLNLRPSSEVSYGSIVDEQNKKWEQQNKMNNMRHISEPIKAYGTSMMMAELAAPGADVVDDATGEVVKKGWDSMTYLEKATYSGKDALGEEGIKGAFGNVKNNLVDKFKGIAPKDVSDEVPGNASQVNEALGEAYPTEHYHTYGSETGPSAKMQLSDGTWIGSGEAGAELGGAVSDPSKITWKGEDIYQNKIAKEVADKLAIKEDLSSRHWLAQSIEGDPDLRQELVDKFTTEQLTNIRDNNLDWRTFDPATGTGTERNTFIDDVLKGLAKPDVGVEANRDEIIDKVTDLDVKEELIQGLDDSAPVVDEVLNQSENLFDIPQGNLTIQQQADNNAIFYSNQDMPSLPDAKNVEVVDNQMIADNLAYQYNEEDLQTFGSKVKEYVDPKLQFIKEKFGDFGDNVKSSVRKSTDPWERKMKKDDVWMPIQNVSGRNRGNLSREDFLQKRYSDFPGEISGGGYLNSPGLFSERRLMDDGTYSGGWKEAKDKFWNYDQATGEYSRTPRAIHPFDKLTAEFGNYQVPDFQEIEALISQGLTREEAERFLMQQ